MMGSSTFLPCCKSMLDLNGDDYCLNGEAGYSLNPGKSTDVPFEYPPTTQLAPPPAPLPDSVTRLLWDFAGLF